MSFRCEECGEAQEPRTSPNMVVTEIRKRQYNNGGSFTLGTEIAKEKKMCDSCCGKAPKEKKIIESAETFYITGAPISGTNAKIGKVRYDSDELS